MSWLINIHCIDNIHFTILGESCWRNISLSAILMKHNHQPSPIETCSSRLLGTISHVRPRKWGASAVTKVVVSWCSERKILEYCESKKQTTILDGKYLLLSLKFDNCDFIFQIELWIMAMTTVSHETHQFKIRLHDSSTYLLQFQLESTIQVRELSVLSWMSCMITWLSAQLLMQKPHVWSTYVSMVSSWTCSKNRNTKILPCSC